MDGLCKSAKRLKSGARECIFRAQIARSESRKFSRGVTNETDLSTYQKEEDLLLDAVRLSIFPVNGHSTLNDIVGSNGVLHDMQCGRTMGHAETEVLDVLSSIPNSLVTHDFSSDSQGEDNAVDPCVDWGNMDQREHPTATLDRSLEQDRAFIDFGSSFVAHARLAMLFYTRNMVTKEKQTNIYESEISGSIHSGIDIDRKHSDSGECDKSGIHEDSASSSSCSHGSRSRRLDMQKAEAAACTAMNIYRLVFGADKEMQSKERIERVMRANGASHVTSNQSRDRQHAEKAVAATHLEVKKTLCGAVVHTSNLIALSDLWQSGLFFGPLGIGVRGGAVGAGCNIVKDDRGVCDRLNDSGMDYMKDGKLSYSKLKMLEVRSRMIDNGMVHSIPTSTSISISAATAYEGRTVTHPREGGNSREQLFDDPKLNSMNRDVCEVSVAETERHDRSVESPVHHDSLCSRTGVTGNDSATTSTACEKDQRVGTLTCLSIAADEVKGMEAAKGLSDSSSSSHPNSNDATNQVEWRRREWEKEDKGCHVMSGKGHIETGRPQGGVSDVAALPTRIGNKKDRRNALRRERFGPVPGLALPPDHPP